MSSAGRRFLGTLLLSAALLGGGGLAARWLWLGGESAAAVCCAGGAALLWGLLGLWPNLSRRRSLFRAWARWAAKQHVSGGPVLNAVRARLLGRHAEACDELDRFQEETGRKTAEIEWLQAWVVLDWLRKRRGPLERSGRHFTQLEALLLSGGSREAELREALLQHELETVSAGELDVCARGFAGLVEECLSALNDSAHPLHYEAEDLLEAAVGPRPLFRAPPWRKWREQGSGPLRRGGGPFLACLRLLGRRRYLQAEKLMTRLVGDGLPTQETEWLRNAAVLCALRLEPGWRSGGDSFAEGFGRARAAGGVLPEQLRFPAAGRAEVVEWCRRAEEALAGQREFLEGLARLRRAFPRELAHVWEVLHPTLPAAREGEVRCLMAGVTAAADRRWEEAERHFERAAILAPDEPTPGVNLFYVLLATRRKEAAYRKAEALLMEFPREAGMCVCLGSLCLRLVEDTESAGNLFRRAHRLEPWSPEPLVLLGELKTKKDEFEAARAYFEQALRVAPRSLEARAGLARLWLEVRHPESAIGILLPHLAEARGELLPRFSYLLYLGYRELGADRRALKHLEQAPPKCFEDPEELDEIVSHLESEHEYSRAMAYGERAFRLRSALPSQDAREDGPARGEAGQA